MSDFALQFIPGGDDKKPSQKAKTSLREQGMSGINEGIAGFLGTPVDLLTTGINAATGGVNKVAGTDIPPIEDPVGGSDSFRRALGFSISDTEPQTVGQRYVRRIGQEVGYGAPLTMATMGAGPLSQAAMQAPKAFAGANVAADVGAGVAGQTAREIAPDNATLDFFASLIGGTGSALGVDRAMRSRPQVQTRAELQKTTDDLYDQVRDSGADLTPQAQEAFNDRLRSRFAEEGGDALAYPKANSQLNVIGNNPRQSVYGVEQARRRLRDKVARSPDEAAIGRDLVDETEAYLRSLTPGDVASNSVNPQDVVETLEKARRSAHQGIKADEITDALNRAGSSAETAGTGGNILNRQSQEIRKIYDKEVSLRKPQASGGYTPDEIEAMRRIVFPGKSERLLQRVGRFAPTTGNLQASLATFGGGGGLMGALATGNPALALAAAPSAAGIASQAMAERLKAKRIEELMQAILNRGRAATPSANPGARAAIVSQLLNAPQ